MSVYTQQLIGFGFYWGKKNTIVDSVFETECRKQTLQGLGATSLELKLKLYPSLLLGYAALRNELQNLVPSMTLFFPFLP